MRGALIGLPQHASPQERFQRERDLAAQRKLYEWDTMPGLPPFCKGLPKPERFTARKKDRMLFDVGESLADAALAVMKWMKAKPGKVNDYRAFYPLRPLPSVADQWMEDREFARQRLDGINPFLITRIDEIPANFAVDDDTVRRVLPDGVTLASLLAEGRLFIIDYGALEGAPIALGRFQEAPIALFWVDSTGTLMPLAIQLGQSQTTAPVVFTPADHWWTWLNARTFVQCAEGTYHEIIAHLTRTHLVMEPFWVAASRTLPPQHPVHMLLRPHFTGTININYEARNELIVPNGPIDETIAVGTEGAYWLVDKAYGDWSFLDWNPRREMERRGVLDTGLLPDYHYRDDALRIFDAIDRYTERLLRLFYRSDEDVHTDTELRTWVTELTSADGGRVRGLPLTDGALATFDDLQTVVCQVIYLVSCEHAAVNNGQYDQFGFIPNSPGAMYLPAPQTRAAIDEAEFTYGLPPMKAVDEQLTLVHLLSEPTLTPLGDYPVDFFQQDRAALLAVDRFRSDLDDLTMAIDERNEHLAVPYTYLRPPEVGRSIAI
jgi:arachidonate 15-lipoxygenase